MKKLFLPLVMALSFIATSCGGTPSENTTSGTPGTSTDTGSDSISVSNTYSISVNASSVVKYSLSKTEAMINEDITLTINSIETNFYVAAVKVNGNAISETSENVYTFKMPGENVVITIEVTEKFVIKVNAPTGLEYQLSSTSAFEGEEVTLTITTTSYIIEAVKVNGNAISETSENVYTFKMPNRSVTISIEASVSGDVVLQGEVVAALSLNPETGIYEALNVSVPYTGKAANFSYKVGNEVLTSIDVDETRCFADITYAYGSSYNEQLLIKSGLTYNFYYNPNLESPCYVQKVSVDRLPETTNDLYSLFDGSIKSENTQHPQDLKDITLNVYKNESESSASKTLFEYNKYDNSSYAKVTDVLSENEFHVYKAYDSETNSFKVVDTFTYALGNEDPTRDYNANLGGAYSATYDVVETESEASKFKMSEKDVFGAIQSSAYTYYNFERLFMDSYRVGFSADEVSFTDTEIVSVDTDAGFDVTLNSTVEYNSSEGTYTEEMHEANVFSLELSFLDNGAVTSIDYLKTNYAKEAWDFTNHTPLIGGTGTTVKKVTGTMSYGHNEGESTFDTSSYFITSFDALSFYNPSTNKPSDDGNNYLHYADKIKLSKISENETVSNVTVAVSPATALDLWQYAPTSSDNESVVASLSNDTYNQMTCVGVGDANVTFTNHTTNTISKTIKINVSATQKFRSLYIYSSHTDDGYNDVLTALSANIVAGEISKFHVGVTPSNAPVVYDAYSSNESLVTVLTHDETLTLDATGAANIKETTTVTIRIKGGFFDTSSGNEYQDLTFNIIPAAISPVGTWHMLNTDGTTSSTTNIVFTDNQYADTDYKTGVVTDLYAGKTDKYYFYYKLTGGQVVAKVYNIEAQNTDVPTDVSTYTIAFYYDAANNWYGLYLGFIASDDEGYAQIYDIIGLTDNEGYVSEYGAFKKVD